MTYHVQFPALGLSFFLSRVAFTIAGVEIYWYGLLIGAGMLLAMLMAMSQARRFGLDSNRMIDVIMIGVICGVVCGRLYYVLFSGGSYETFAEVMDIRSGGIAIYGGVIGGFIGALIGCRLRRVPILPMFDVVAMGFLIGQSIGRWGNFVNQEAFGKNTALPWGMISEGTTGYLTMVQQQLAQQGMIVDPALPVHPTFLYESLWCALGFVLLFAWRKRRHFHGELFLFYLIWYGLGRFFIEGLRTDALLIPGVGLRVSQVLAATSVMLALLAWFFGKAKQNGKPLLIPIPPDYTAKVRVETPEGVQTVEISWPAQDKPPTKAERNKMALQQLAKAQQALETSVSSPEEKEAVPQSEEQAAVVPKPDADESEAQTDIIPQNPGKTEEL